jgi:peptidoglycan/xylan/chitin deacetylase (PgdA/CDA1 family)
MQFLRGHYRVVSLEEVCRGLRDPQVSEPGVAITFDDGYRSAYTDAFPILQKYRLPATIYVTFDCVETGEVAWYDRVFLAMAVAPSGEVQLDFDGPWSVQLNSHEDRLRAALEIVAYLRALPNLKRQECCALLEKRIALPRNELSGRVLTWQQIHTMQEAGVSFGSHTLTHPVVSRLAPAELVVELSESKRLLEEKLGTPVTDFAFPFGKESDCSVAAVEQLSRCGYRSAVTTVSGANTPQVSPFELRRLQVGDDESLARFAFELNQAFLRREAPRVLNALPMDLILEQNNHHLKSIGGAFGGPDA